MSAYSGDRSTPAGWHADPQGIHEYRYFNGQEWTADVANNGERFVAPLIEEQLPPSRLGRLSLRVGVAALAVSWLPLLCFVGLSLSMIAIVLGVRSRTRQSEAGRAGIVLGLAAAVLSAGGIWFTVVVVNMLNEAQTPTG